MTGEAVQKLLKEEIYHLNIEIPPTVYQFNFAQKVAEQYLNEHPEVPFILRLSEETGYFSLDMPNQNQGGFASVLISPPNEGEKEFKVGFYENSVFTEISSLKEYVNKYWDPERKCMLSDSALAERKNEVWEKFKHTLEEKFVIQRRRKEEEEYFAKREIEHRKELSILQKNQEETSQATPEEKIPKQPTAEQFAFFNRTPRQGQEQATYLGNGFFQEQSPKERVQQGNNHLQVQTKEEQSFNG